MSDVTITYKGASIATMDATGSKTLQTAGTYCEGDIGVEYVKPGGGGPVSVPAKEVNFRDYDGTVVYSYTPVEFAALSAMPDNPDHSHDEIPLTSQGWNWSFADAQAYVAKYGRLEVGQMYATADGKTHVLIHLAQGRTSPILGCCPNGTVDVDWGDGTAHDTLTGTSVTSVMWTPTHNYAAPGDYDIKLTCTGSMGFYGSSSSNEYSGLLRYGVNADSRNSVYQNTLQSVYCANDITSIGQYAFNNCRSLSSIAIPNSATSIGQYAFQTCYSLSSIAIPNGVTSIGQYTFYNCRSLSSIAIPDSVTSIGDTAFFNCNGLSCITIPDGVTSIGQNALGNCYSMSSIAIPNSVTSIGFSAFSNSSLSSIVIPNGVTRIEQLTFQNCYGLAELHFKPTTPPTVPNSNAFSGVPTDCIIYVPTGSLAAYKAATNYPSRSTYTYIEE